MLRSPIVVLPLLLVVACSGGGSSTADPSPQPRQSGALQILLDPSTGSPALVQVQVAAAVLETDAGQFTGDVLGEPRMLTLADPTGTLDGLELPTVPAGSYQRLHLGLVPGSGVARYPDGTTVTVTLGADLAIPFAEVVDHDGQRNSWVLCGHDGMAPPTVTSGPIVWSPSLGGRVEDSAITLAEADVAFVAAASLTVEVACLPGAPLVLTFAPECTFLGEDGLPMGGRGPFLATVSRPAQVMAEGVFSHRGEVIVRQIRHRGNGYGNTGPRLIGRITSIDLPSESFTMDVFAEARRGGPALLALPATAEVFVQNARIQRSNGTALAFGDLAPGQLAKVEWQSRIPDPNGPETVEAIEVEVSPAGGVGMAPQWQGAVSAVDLVSRTITIGPRGESIVIGGQVRDPVTLHVAPAAEIERHEPGRNGRSSITLDLVVPGHDRIWFRGQVTGPAEVEAGWLRVRDDS